MRWIFKITGVIPVSPAKAREAITKAADHIAAGEIVCIFPEGAISRTGAMQGLKRGFELIARRSKAPVIPVGLDGLWGSIFSYERNKFFNKKPLQIPYPARVTFGKPSEYTRCLLTYSPTGTARPCRRSLLPTASPTRPHWSRSLQWF